MPGARIIRCGLPSGHPGEHEEDDTEVTWLPEPVPVVEGDEDRPMSPVESALYEHFRHLGCLVTVDPLDVEDCAGMAVEVIRFLSAGGWMRHGGLERQPSANRPSAAAAATTTPPEGDPMSPVVQSGSGGSQAVVLANLAEISRNLTAHIAERAQEIATPQIAEAVRAADARVAEVKKGWALDRGRSDDLIAEFRRQLTALDKRVERQTGWLREHGINPLTGLKEKTDG